MTIDPFLETKNLLVIVREGAEGRTVICLNGAQFNILHEASPGRPVVLGASFAERKRTELEAICAAAQSLLDRNGLEVRLYG